TGGAAEDAAAPDTAPADAAASDAAGDAAPAMPTLVWPNPTSSVNSDPWLVQHHTEIRELHPRFLLIHFANGHSVAQVMTRFEQQKEAMMEGSRYHAYANPAAKPFVVYEL